MNVRKAMSSSANKPSTPAELASSGWEVKVKMPPNRLIHAYRNRLPQDVQATLKSTVRSSHIIGGDALDPVKQLREHEAVLPDASWTANEHSHPMWVLPTHLFRVQEMAARKFRDPFIKFFTVIGTMDRSVAEKVVDNDSMQAYWSPTKQGQDMLERWGKGLHIQEVFVFLDAPQVLRFPRDGNAIPPEKWVEAELHSDRSLVAVTVGRERKPICVSQIGSAKPIAERRKECVRGLIPIVFEIEAVQRNAKAGDHVQLARKAIRELIAKATGRNEQVMVGRILAKGEVLSAVVDLPPMTASEVVKKSGAVRGTFARPFLGRTDKAVPEGFGEGKHRVVWSSTNKYSDVVYRELQAKEANFDGLVCATKRGEVGVRISATQSEAKVKEAMKAAFGEVRIKVSDNSKVRLKIKNVPAVLTFDPQLGGLLDRIQKGASIVPNTMRMLGGTVHTRDVEVLAVGLPTSGSVWEVNGVGLKSVVIQRTGGKAKKVEQRTIGGGESVKIKKPLTKDQQRSWADVVRPKSDNDKMEIVPVPQSTSTENFVPVQRDSSTTSPKPEPRGRGRPRSSTPSQSKTNHSHDRTSKFPLQRPSGNQRTDMGELLEEIRRSNNEIVHLRKENEELKAKLFQLLNTGEKPMEGVEVDLKRRRSQDDNE